MFRDTVLRCLVIVTIARTKLTSGESCAYGVHQIRNSTGCYVTWSSLGQNCNTTWLRDNPDGRDTILSSKPPMSITCGQKPQIICLGKHCETVYDIVEVTVPTTRPTTSTRSVTTSPTNFPISNTVTSAPSRGPTDDVPTQGSSLTMLATSTVSITRLTAWTESSQNVPEGPEDEFPTVAVVASVVCSVLLAVVVVLVVCLVRRRRKHSDKTPTPVENNTVFLRREDIQRIDESGDEGGHYAGIAEVNNHPSDAYAVAGIAEVSNHPSDAYAVAGIAEVSNHPSDEYAMVVKNKDRMDTATGGDTYAIVQKPKKVSGHAAHPGYAEVQIPTNEPSPVVDSGYAEVQIPTNEPSPVVDSGYAEVQIPTNEPSPVVDSGYAEVQIPTNGLAAQNKDGLIYLDVEFGGTPGQTWSSGVGSSTGLG